MAPATRTPVWKLPSYVSRGVGPQLQVRPLRGDARPRHAWSCSAAPGGCAWTRRRSTGSPASPPSTSAFHNGHPEDAWAFTDWLLSRNPDRAAGRDLVHPGHDVHGRADGPGLIVDTRLSQGSPRSSSPPEMDRAMSEPERNLLQRAPVRVRRDAALERVRPQARSRQHAAGAHPQLPRPSDDGHRPATTRSRTTRAPRRTSRRRCSCSTSTASKPLLVIMPYQPKVLSAFLSVGWGVKEQRLHRYLRAVRTPGTSRCSTASHQHLRRQARTGSTTAPTSTAANSQTLIRYCIRKAPGCFRVTPADAGDAERPRAALVRARARGDARCRRTALE